MTTDTQRIEMGSGERPFLPPSQTASDPRIGSVASTALAIRGEGAMDVALDSLSCARTLNELLQRSSVAEQIPGLLTAANAYAGYQSLLQGHEGWEAARERKDVEGMVQHGLTMGYATAQMLGGVTFLGARVMNLWAGLQGIEVSAHSSCPSGVATFSLNTAGGIFFSLFHLGLGVQGGYNLVRGGQFLYEWNQGKDYEKQLQFLLTALQSDVTAAKLARITSPEVVKEVQRANKHGLAARLKSSDTSQQFRAGTEVTLLNDKVSGVAKKNMWKNATFVLMGLTGVVATVLSLGLFATPVGWAIAATVATVALLVIMTGFDWYQWKAGLDQGPVGKHDKLILRCLIGFLVVSLSVTAGVTFGLGLALTPFIVTMVAGGVSLGVAGLNYHKLKAKQEKWDKEHPSLEQFAERLKFSTSSRLMEDEVDYFKLLSKEDRLAVRAHYNEEVANPDAVLQKLYDAQEFSWLQRAAKKARNEFFALGKEELGLEMDNTYIALKRQRRSQSLGEEAKRVFAKHAFALSRRESDRKHLQEVVDDVILGRTWTEILPLLTS